MRNKCDKTCKVLFTVSEAWRPLTVCQRVPENTDMLAAAIVNSWEFSCSWPLPKFPVKCLSFFSLIRGAFDIACYYWSFVFPYGTWDVIISILFHVVISTAVVRFVFLTKIQGGSKTEGMSVRKDWRLS